jgi:hypothetical protein
MPIRRSTPSEFWNGAMRLLKTAQVETVAISWLQEECRRKIGDLA